MNYKLINKTTQEKQICSKVVIDGFDYYVSTEKYKEGDILCCICNGTTQRARIEHLVEQRGNDNQWKKIIATNNNNYVDLPQVIDEVTILIENEYPLLNVGEPSNVDWTQRLSKREGFIKGYKKSRETHSFNECDMVEFGLFCANFAFSTVEDKTRKELLELWKAQQSEIIYFN